MHPENELPPVVSDSGTWWATVLTADRRRRRVRRVVGNVLAFALTFGALTALLAVVNLIDR